MADASTLPVVNAIQELQQANTDNRQRLQKSLRAGLLNVRRSIDELHDTLKRSYEESLKANAFARENALEESRRQDVKEQEQNTKADKRNMFDFSEFSFSGLKTLGVIVGTVAATLGAIAGQFQAMFVTIKGINRLFGGGRVGSIGPEISKFAMLKRDISGFFSNLFKSIRLGFSGFILSIQMQLKLFLKTTKIGSIISGVFARISGAFTFIANLFKGVGGIVTGIGKQVKLVTGTISKIGSFFSTFSVLGKLFGTVSFLAKKIFAPIAIIIGLFDGINDALKEGEKKGFLGYVGGFVKGLINSLIMAPLDLLKNGIAWIVDWIGLKGVASFIRSFSLAEIFSKLVDSITDTIKTVFSWDSKKAEEKGYVAYVGEKLLDIAMMPINGIINLVRDLFGWNEEDEKGIKERFDIIEFVTEIVDGIWEGIKSVFDDIVNFDYTTLVPDWARSFLGLEPKGSAEAIETGGEQGADTVTGSYNPFVEPTDTYSEELKKWEKLKQEMAQYQNDGALVNSVGSVVAPTNVNVVAPTNSTNQTNIRNDNSNKTFVPANANKNKNSPQTDYAASPLW